MAMSSYEELLEDINQRIKEGGVDPSQGPRQVFYVPFSPEQDQSNLAAGRESHVLECEDYVNVIKVRSFAKEVQNRTRATNPEFSADKSNVIEAFDALSKDDQIKILEKVASKEPVIIRHADKVVTGIKETDIINVIGHGARNKNTLQSNSGVELDAETIANRLERDFPGNFKMIKLHACGSSGELQKGLVAQFRGKGIYSNAVVRGYDHDVVSHLKFVSKSLMFKALGKGVRYTASEEVAKELKLASQKLSMVSQGYEKLNGHIDALEEKADDLQDKRDLLGNGPETLADREKLTQKVGEIHDEIKKAESAKTILIGVKKKVKDEFADTLGKTVRAKDAKHDEHVTVRESLKRESDEDVGGQGLGQPPQKKMRSPSPPRSP